MARRIVVRNYQRKLPNPDLIKTLHHLYYVVDASPKKHISSHWKKYSQNFKFQLGGDGLPSEVSGYGFGDCEVRKHPYQFLSSLSILCYLAMFSNRLDLIRIMRMARPVCRRMGLTFGQDAFRQVCSLALIERHLLPIQRENPLRAIIIGDGYGVLASLLKEIFPKSTIVLVDFGKVLLFQAYYCQKAHPDKCHQAVMHDGKDIVVRSDFVYCPAEFLSEVSQLSYDLAVNIASMQEMTTESIISYFGFLRQHMEADGLFYCCNRERKILVGGEIQEFRRYPWHPKDVHLVDERCTWHNYYVSFATKVNGPRVLGVRVPFVNYYDGPTWHRLTRLSQGQ